MFTESSCNIETGAVSVRVKPGDLSLGKPGSRNSALSPAAAGHVATLYASLSRPQHHQTRVSPTGWLRALSVVNQCLR